MDERKIVIAGLDKAGKSSIIQRVFFNADPDEIKDLEPTRGIQREEIKLDRTNGQFVFWELGGQQRYLDDYTQKPQVFSQVQLLIFVIDIQDNERYEIAINYLQQLLFLLRETSNNCHVTIIMHKFDPEMSTSLRSKQFILLKLLKSIQSQFNSFQFSQHSTSIYDDTLFYTYQNIFDRLGIDLGTYKSDITSNIRLKETPEKPKSDNISASSSELIDHLDSIYESASSATKQIAPLFNNLSGITKLHEIMTHYITQFHEVGSVDVRKETVDILIMAYLEFISSLTIDALKENRISEEEGKLILYFIGQLNVVKVHFIHYVTKTRPFKMKNPLKFMEQLKQLSNDMIDASYIVDNISLDQIQQLKPLINGSSNPDFSLFDQDNQDVYTFSSIQELKSAFSQDKFVPAKMIIKIELAEQLKNMYIDHLSEIIAKQPIDPSQSDLITWYVTRLEYMILEFYQLVVDQNLKEYDLERVINAQFFQITLQLLSIANLANIITDEEKLQLRNLIEQNR